MPRLPVAPVSPYSPGLPGIPLGPIGPAGPLFPCGPAGPVAPRKKNNLLQLLCVNRFKKCNDKLLCHHLPQVCQAYHSDPSVLQVLCFLVGQPDLLHLENNRLLRLWCVKCFKNGNEKLLYSPGLSGLPLGSISPANPLYPCEPARPVAPRKEQVI